jgi:predicted GIY-YIG superfamily endonuclease
MKNNKLYSKWKADGWYLYVLSNGTDYYIGITSNPGNRLRDHIKRSRLSGKIWYQFIRPVGFYWRALELERALKRMTKAFVWTSMSTKEDFERFVQGVPERTYDQMSEHARFIYDLYHKETRCITAT